jgi:putative ABC transport system permease protein
LAYRQLTHDMLRTVMTVLAVGAVIAVILVLEGFRTGIYAQLRSGVLDRGGDLIVTQAGIANMIGTRSVLPQLLRLDVEDVEGVGEAHPLTGLPIIYERDGRRTPIFLFVYDTLGGPREIAEGRPLAGPHEIVIDRSLAKKYGLKPGDAFEVSEFTFTVAGIASESSALFTAFGFVSYDGLIDFYFESDMVADITTFPLLSFLLVELEPAARVADVAAGIEAAIPEADVFLPEELARRDQELGESFVGPVLGVLLLVTYVIGVIVVGLFMFSAIDARRRALGVLRALGFTSRALAGSTVFEATVICVLAIPVGVVLALAIAEAIHGLAPLYLVLPAAPDLVLRTAVGSLAFALAGAVLPIRAIARLDPAQAFRS